MFSILDFNEKIFPNIISPLKEMIAYEAIWDMTEKASFKKIFETFKSNKFALPSLIVTNEVIDNYHEKLKELIEDKNDAFEVIVNHTFNYPEKLRDAQEPVEVLYYKGNLELLKEKSVAVVGSRNISEEGKKRTKKLVKGLVENGYTIASGLAKGVDTYAHLSAIYYGGKTFAVIGTPINMYYPKENKSLQDHIAKKYLLISQVPIIKYSKQGIKGNRLFFPERNKTMSALTDATIIVEASDTSGSLTQARAAFAQGRKLFILDSCFENKDITWPAKFEKQGAIRVKVISDILNNL
ncbi:DNA-protecting protein DprA [Elizabethkingia anophelis]|nr:DNA-protecting protein DprA [Elizabethkingia anophelis]MCT3706337.1 DNA-protecting protein DprA [Elizabethkingia anophelis]MCT3713355.1 DNA-protecting protein DprA [Elizabethkingia anophelis]MCT3716773.1 DNA-protecting protein DprA [Elizabethkingia anophelis]MCT3730468.1 DNA-protecting protein DprA [Elizabethkingia anophelis]